MPKLYRSTPLCASTFGHGFATFPKASRTGGTTLKAYLQSLTRGYYLQNLPAILRKCKYLGSVDLRTACPKPGIT